MEPNLNDLLRHGHVSNQPPYLIHPNDLPSPPPDGGGGGGGNRLLFSSPAQMASPTAAPAPALAPAPSAIPARKRGRPRKYGTPEMALAARKAGATASPGLMEGVEESLLHQLRRESVVGNSDDGGGDGRRGYFPGMSMAQLSYLVDAGRGFVPHVIYVAAGDDVAQRVMEFTQQSKRETCILSASGSLSTVSLQQPATTGGTITYGGLFEIITLSGSFLRTNLGGTTSRLSICLSSPDGQIIGGGIGGPLMAASPVQVIIGSFIHDAKKDDTTAITDTEPSRTPPPSSSVYGELFFVHPR
ncbi:hypothetical protein MLD38_035956 [Melastoma candidum]|uniref:Uncharacterized protein n=1 Tax=Melastoma candidum TaxID=119954 RepID=A0ACB9LI70_9MYRT|nr:hypothetical protein MLD38_035956 [Melastoma candidum]